MSKHVETVKDAVKKYVEYNPCNPCWHDSYYLENIKGIFGREVVNEELKLQER